jgi:hypothetical protein
MSVAHHRQNPIESICRNIPLRIEDMEISGQYAVNKVELPVSEFESGLPKNFGMLPM